MLYFKYMGYTTHFSAFSAQREYFVISFCFQRLGNLSKWGLLVIEIGAPVAQLVKRWPTDLAVSSSMPARGKIFSTVKVFRCTQPSL